MSYGDGDLQLQNAPQDNNNLRADWGPTPYDIRHAFNANFVYELLFARLTGDHDPVSKRVLGGWQVSGIVVATTGTPINITDASPRILAAGLTPWPAWPRCWRITRALFNI